MDQYSADSPRSKAQTNSVAVVFALQRAILGNRTLSLPGRIILTCLATYANSDGYAWPAIKTICEITNYQRRTVRRHLEEGIQAGILTKTINRGRHKTNVYQFNLEIVKENGAPGDRKTARLATENGAPGALQTPITPLTSGVGFSAAWKGGAPLPQKEVNGVHYLTDLDFLKKKFEEFMEAYPREYDNADNAFRAYRSALEKTTHSELIKAADEYWSYIDGKRVPAQSQYVKFPENWLREEKWDIDWLETLEEERPRKSRKTKKRYKRT